MNISVYIPAPLSTLAARIDGGSGLVGSQEGKRVLIDYEGNRYGAANLVTFADRVAHAADRHQTRYPTVARALVEASDLQLIGSYDPKRGIVQLNAEDDADAALARWLGEEARVESSELETTGVRQHAFRQIEAALASGDQRQMLAARQLARRLQIELD